jgi:hypothetical protein
MKLLACALIALFLALPARADGDNLLQNGDFADGLDHWYGGGRSPADFANDNPLAASDPFTSKGLIMPLHDQTWTKVAQDLRGNVSNAELTVTFKVSKDFAFSTKPDYYNNTPVQIGYGGWKPLDTPVGNWVIVLADAGSSFGYFDPIPVKPGSSDPQTVHVRFTGLTPGADKKITLAFPPGTGMVVVLSVTLTGQ